MYKNRKFILTILMAVCTLLIVPAFVLKASATNSTDGNYYVYFSLSDFTQGSWSTTYLKDEWDRAHFEEGDEVDLSKYSINLQPGFVFDHFKAETYSSVPVAIVDNKFIMPADNVNVCAVLKCTQGLKLYTAVYSNETWTYEKDEQFNISGIQYDNVKLVDSNTIHFAGFTTGYSSIFVWNNTDEKYDDIGDGWMTAMYRPTFECGKKYFLTFCGRPNYTFEKVYLNDVEIAKCNYYPYSTFSKGYYQNGDNIYVGMEVDLEKVTVSFNANGGTGSIDPVETVKNYTIPTGCDGITPPQGKIFKGWSLSSTGEIVSDNIVLTDDTELFAIWKPNVNENYITISPLNVGTKIEDVVFASSNGIADTTIAWRESKDERWPAVTSEVIEAGKTYWIKVVFDEVTDADVLVGGNIIVNGEQVPFSSGSVSAPDCAFTLQSTSKFTLYYSFKTETVSSGSKTYKAKDTNDTAEKIAGSGKKGSKRTITPIEGKKVGKVTVTDKDGNPVEVTKNEDGTYSFKQPASDVEVEVTYVNREITLNIGSTEADVDGEKSNLDVCPVIRNDRTMLPIRFVAENLGAKVEWDEKNPDYVLITKGDIKIEITLGSDVMKVNGKDVKLDSIAFAENDRTYLPVRAISENLNAIVEWNEAKPMEVKIYER